MNSLGPLEKICQEDSITGFTPLEKATDREQNSLTGFTLLEILMVVVIIGVLVTIGIPQYNRIIERSRQVEGINILLAVHGAQMRYYYENNYDYPPDDIYPLDRLDIEIPELKYFDESNLTMNTDGYASIPRDATDTTWNYTLIVNAAGQLDCEQGSSDCPGGLP